MSKGTLSVQLYTFREAYQHDAPGTLERVAEMGFKYVEPFGLGAIGQPAAGRLERARLLANHLKSSGLKVSSAHTAAPVGPHAESILDELSLLGVKLAVVPAPGQISGYDVDSLATLQGTLRLAELLCEAQAAAASRGMELAFHNHWWEWNTRFENGQYPYDVLLEGCPEVVIEMDIYWAHVAGQNPAQLLERFGDRVKAIHLKDGPGVPRVEAVQLPLGEGIVDYQAALGATAARWHVLELDTSPDPFRDVQLGAQRLMAEKWSGWK